MKSYSLWCAYAAFASGVLAAIFWWLSARIDQRFIPRPPVGDVTKEPEALPGYLEEIYRYLFKVSDTLKQVSSLNRIAALLTGVSVFFSGLSSLLAA